MAQSAAYEISPWRIAALLPVEAGIYAAQQAGQIETHTAHSLMVGVLVAMSASGANACWQSRGNLIMTSDHRRLAAMGTGIAMTAVTMGLHPGANQGEQLSDAQAAGLDALGAGVLTGVLTYALWRKSKSRK